RGGPGGVLGSVSAAAKRGSNSEPNVFVSSEAATTGSTRAALLPKRTTKQAGKLALLNPPEAAAQVSTSPSHPHNILPEHLLSREGRKYLPRVTAYCTAASYNLDSLEAAISRQQVQPFVPPHLDLHCKNPQRFDEALYASCSMMLPPPPQLAGNTADLLGLGITGTHAADLDPRDVDGPYADMKRSSNANSNKRDDVTSDQGVDESIDEYFQTNVDSRGMPLPQTVSYQQLAKRISPFGECFFFDYGVAVIWGLTEQEEKTLLRSISAFREEKFTSTESFQTEDFHFYYNTASPSRIFNDVITLRRPGSVRIKLTISHAIAQSVKLAVFEGLVENTIENTRHIPRVLSETGKIHMSRKAINQKIGQLFIMRINVNLVSNVLDTPEIFWSEPDLQPLYSATRKYLEISQRVELLNQRVAVISDLLDMLKENLNSTHGENLEWVCMRFCLLMRDFFDFSPQVVIILILLEIVIGIAMILVDVIHTDAN
ncbi:MAG: hypothetical protein SGCHY_001711, partial [Lobulomycetales sp.]